MVSVEKALEIIAQNTKTLDKIVIDVREALGYVLADEILSPINLPSFPQSAMDGYACKWSDLIDMNGRLPLQGESRAGSEAEVSLQKGTAMRIFTGAPVPIGADCVIIQEEVEMIGEEVNCKNFKKYVSGKNVRKIGEEIKEGDKVLLRGHVINAPTIGVLISLGYDKVEVFKKPEIGVIVTGSELAEIGNVRKSGQVYESNSHTLKAALNDYGFSDITIVKVTDNLEDTTKILSQLSQEKDALIISGGISVGDYDFVGKAMNTLNAKEYFYKIRQKPGKPMYYGLLNKSSIFALPGNPGSMLTCFLIYVLPSLNGMAGKFRELPRRKMQLNQNLKVKGERAHFLKAKISEDKVNILDRQNSSMLSSFAESDGLVYLPEASNSLSKGEWVEVIQWQYLLR